MSNQDTINIAQRKRRAEHKKKGLCIDCTNHVLKGYSRCAYHVAKNNTDTARRYYKRLSNGRCGNCGGMVDQAGSKCINCYETHKRYQDVLRSL